MSTASAPDPAEGSDKRSTVDVKPAANELGFGSAEDVRRVLESADPPNIDELAKFRATKEMESGFEDLQRNMKALSTQPSAFDKYKDGWNAVCDLLQEVAKLRRQNAELDRENDCIIELVQEVGDLKCVVARLETENLALKQENEDLKETLQTKISGIDAWVRADRARARAEALEQAEVHDRRKSEEHG
ncbi:hypothetical protein AURDEDRAFT_166728 [Auricularia subglabra TFB-10046 SS5]|nr:hypothetical protein AURDEDRAFT_166728 [Auricularia subglabra TFB-10046 SS5]